MLPLSISFLSFFLLLNPAASKCVPRNLPYTQNPKPATQPLVIPNPKLLLPKPTVPKPVVPKPPTRPLVIPNPKTLLPKPTVPKPAVPKPPTRPLVIPNPKTLLPKPGVPKPAVPKPVVPVAPKVPIPPPKTNPKGPIGAVGGKVSGAASPALKGACDKTDYPDICMATLTPFSGGLTKPDPVALLKISVAASVAETKTVMQTAEKLMAQKAGSVASLQDCLDNYKDALENFQSALDAIPANDLGTINSMLSAAVTDYSTCDDSFEDANPLLTQDEKLSHMGSNCLAMAALLEH